MAEKHKLLAITFDEVQEDYINVSGLDTKTPETWPDRAEGALKDIKRDSKEKGFTLDDAVIVHKTPKGGLKIRESKDMTTGKGAGRGAFWGLLVGLIFGGPLLGLLGGLGIGAVFGKAVDHGIDNQFIKDVGNSLRPTRSAILMLVPVSDYDNAMAYLKTYDTKIYEADFSEETHAAVKKAAEDPKVADAVEAEYK